MMTAIRSGLTVVQVPVAMRPRQGGEPSHSPGKAAIYLVRSAFSLLIAMTRRRTPALELPESTTTREARHGVRFHSSHHGTVAT